MVNLDASVNGCLSVTDVGSQLLKPEEVRELLNVSRSWLYEAANEGRIPSMRLGPEGPLRFDRAEIEEWLQRRRNRARQRRR